MLGWCSSANHESLSSFRHGFKSHTEQFVFLLFETLICTTGIPREIDILLKCYGTTLITHANV